MTTQTFTGILTIITCSSCHMPYGVTAQFEREMRSDRRTFYCPSGHSQWFPGKTDAQKAREEEAAKWGGRLATAERSEQFYRDQATSERRHAAAQKGQRTRLLNLITKGIYPVAGCRRNFSNIRAHMAAEHPGFHLHDRAPDSGAS